MTGFYDKTFYGIRVHDRETEDDPRLATIMYANKIPDGPWFDMVTGYPEHCYEVLEALEFLQEYKKSRRNEGYD